MIMSEFFEDPDKEFYIRELSRILKINHTTIRQYLNKLVMEELLTLKKNRIYSAYKVIISRKYLNLKLFYNIEKIRKSKIIESIQESYDFPVIILFGSYAKATDTKNSDIDICIISEIKKEFDTKKYKKLLNKEVEIHHFTKANINTMIKKNPEFINSLCNGIVLSGELEILK